MCKVKFDYNKYLFSKNSDYHLSQGGAIYYEPNRILKNDSSITFHFEDNSFKNCMA